MSADRLHGHEVDNVGNPGREVTTVNALELDFDGDETTLPLIELIDDLQKTLSAIPEEFRETAVVTICGYGEYVSLQGRVEFKRPETDEEFAARKRWLASLQTEDEDRDQREFARLKAKYERSPAKT